MNFVHDILMSFFEILCQIFLRGLIPYQAAYIHYLQIKCKSMRNEVGQRIVVVSSIIIT